MPTSASISAARSSAILRLTASCDRTASASWSPMLYTGFSAVIGSWKIMAIRRPRSARFSRGWRLAMSLPSKMISPVMCALRGSRPITARLETDLPEPDSPTMASTSRRARS